MWNKTSYLKIQLLCSCHGKDFFLCAGLKYVNFSCEVSALTWGVMTSESAGCFYFDRLGFIGFILIVSDRI